LNPWAELLVFDLDGTLVDSTLDLANSVNAARVHMGLEAPSRSSPPTSATVPRC